MGGWIHFFYLCVIGMIEYWLEFHFFVKFIGKKDKGWQGLLFALFTSIFVGLVNVLVEVKMILLAAALALFGGVFYRVWHRSAFLYAMMVLAVMQICFGIFNSVTGLVGPALYSLNPGMIAWVMMILGGAMSLGLAYFCYHLIDKYLLPLEAEENRYAILILLPLLLTFLACNYVNQSIYGNTIELGEPGRFTAIHHGQMLLFQVLGILSLFCMMYAYQRMIQNFQIRNQLNLLKQETCFQRQYVEEAKARYEKTISFRHDMKNHLMVLNGLLEKGETDQAALYLERLESVTAELSFPCRTGRPVLDILIGNKLGIAVKKQIQVSCSLHIPEPCEISDLDFCILISNALDNALHACESLKEDTGKYIQISGRTQGDFLLIEVENSCNGRLFWEKGIGLSNMETVAGKYQGAVSTDQSETRFFVSILLVIPRRSEDIPQQVH